MLKCYKEAKVKKTAKYHQTKNDTCSNSSICLYAEPASLSRIYETIHIHTDISLCITDRARWAVNTLLHGSETELRKKK